MKEDSVISTLEFRNWRSLCKSNSSALQTLTELIQLIDTEDDEDFEEIDDDTEETKDEGGTTTLPTNFVQTLAFSVFD